MKNDIYQIISRLNRGYLTGFLEKRAVAEVAAALGDIGRIVIRESGTEPVVRVMVEAETAELCDEYTGRVIEVIREKGHEYRC